MPRVYSFRLPVRPFVCSFVLPSVCRICVKVLRQSFSSGVYLSNYLLESIYIRTIVTLFRVGIHSRTRGSMPRGGARGQNLGHLKKCFFVLESPNVDTGQTTHQKAFIFDHLVSCSVGFDFSTTSDMRVHARGGTRGKNQEHLRFFSFAFFSCMELFVFEQQILFRVDSP